MVHSLDHCYKKTIYIISSGHPEGGAGGLGCSFSYLSLDSFCILGTNHRTKYRNQVALQSGFARSSQNNHWKHSRHCLKAAALSGSQVNAVCWLWAGRRQPRPSHTFHWKLIEHFIPLTDALISSSILHCDVVNFQDAFLPHNLQFMFFIGFELLPILHPLHSSVCVWKLSLKFGFLTQPSRDLFYIFALIGKSHCSTCQEQRPRYFDLCQANMINACCKIFEEAICSVPALLLCQY